MIKVFLDISHQIFPFNFKKKMSIILNKKFFFKKKFEMKWKIFLMTLSLYFLIICFYRFIHILFSYITSLILTHVKLITTFYCFSPIHVKCIFPTVDIYYKYTCQKLKSRIRRCFIIPLLFSASLKSFSISPQSPQLPL